MLQPARRKYRKEQKGRNTGLATRGTNVSFGDFGLKATERGRITARQIEAAVAGEEAAQVQGGQVAGRVVQEHIFGAGIRSVDAGGVLAGMPPVNGGIELHAGVAALVGGFGDGA